MLRILDPGHAYQLLTLDGTAPQELRFVKRCYPPERYPGNTTRYSGTTLQSALRCLIERTTYLQGQFWCLENWIILRLLRWAVWLLEFRAARRHKQSYWHGPKFATTASMCTMCGHTQCECIPF